MQKTNVQALKREVQLLTFMKTRAEVEQMIEKEENTTIKLWLWQAINE